MESSKLAMEAIAALVVVPGDGSPADANRLAAIKAGMSQLTARGTEERIILSVSIGIMAMALNIINARDKVASRLTREALDGTFGPENKARAEQNGKPQKGRVYRLTGGSDEASILRGDPLEDCEVPE